MRNTGLVIDDRFQLHDPGAGHPDSPQRLAALARLFDADPFRALPRVRPREAAEAELARVHSASHVAAVAASAGRAMTRFDADTGASAGSFLAARLAAGAAIEIADAILEGSLDNGFAALRPPGHHAEPDHPMGFCLFNNVAVVARHLRARGVERVLVLDWDVHHGNGTHHTFYADPEVMYVSLHQYPFYPGTGAAVEIGSGAGQGYTVNVPLAAGTGGDTYLAAMRDVVLPTALRFDPRFVLVSAGFDAHRDDPLAQLALESEDYAELTSAMVEIADACADGRILLLLEGGYDLAALSESVRVSVERLREPKAAGLGTAEAGAGARDAARALAPYWKI